MSHQWKAGDAAVIVVSGRRYLGRIAAQHTFEDEDYFSFHLCGDENPDTKNCYMPSFFTTPTPAELAEIDRLIPKEPTSA